MSLIFNSLDFLVFFFVFCLIYFILPHKFRWILLLTGSYYFYMSFKAEYAILLLISTVVDYFAARRMGKIKKKEKRKKYLYLSIIVNLGILFSFKYVNFFSDSVRGLLSSISLEITTPYIYVLLPIGISFYTFQTLSYTIDVYRGKIKPEKHFGIFAVYVSFFPQLVAGPIERAGNLIPQFYKKQDFDIDRIIKGLKIMLWGFFLKIVIADNAGVFVNKVYEDPESFTGLSLIIATYLFRFQIYGDFAGYSFIALGAAMILGIKLTQNFNRPFISKSISGYWKRWHITLYDWFRDYVYIPLGGSRVSKSRYFLNILIVFFLIGLWHGASWNFIIWGSIYGFYIIFSILTHEKRKKISKYLTSKKTVLKKIIGLTLMIAAVILNPFTIEHFFSPDQKFDFVWKYIVIQLVGLIIFYQGLKLSLNKSRLRISNIAKILIVFNLSAFAAIFFRSKNLSDALYIVTHLFSDLSLNISRLISTKPTTISFIIIISSIFIMEFIEHLQGDKSIYSFLDHKSKLIRWFIYILLILMILLFGNFRELDFIYFRF